LLLPEVVEEVLLVAAEVAVVIALLCPENPLEAVLVLKVLFQYQLHQVLIRLLLVLVVLDHLNQVRHHKEVIQYFLQ
jgi:hypothetical protein